MLVGGLTRPQAPRTSVERDILASEAQTKVEPKNAKAWQAYADALVRAGRYGDASDAIRRGRLNVGQHPIFMSSEASILLSQGEWQAAIAKAREAVKLALKMRKARVEELSAKGIVSNPKAFYSDEIVVAEIMIAETYMANGRNQESVDAYTRALAQSPLMADVLTARGDVYASMKRYDEARSDYDAALKYGPDYAPALEGLKNLGTEGAK